MVRARVTLWDEPHEMVIYGKKRNSIKIRMRYVGLSRLNMTRKVV